MASRSIRRGFFAAGAALVMLTGLVTAAAPAQARADEAVDVTRATTRNFWVAPMWKPYGATIYRSEDYSASAEGRYVYVAEVGEIWDSGKRCVLTRNGTVIVNGTCNDNVPWGGLELPGSGTYILTTNGRRRASWKFTMPSDVPTPLSPATCEITSFRPGLVGKLGPTFEITTNGLCSRGYWYYEADFPDGGEAYRRFRLPANGVILARDLIDNTEPVTMTVVFLPRGYQVLTASSLATPAGTTPAWRPVPQPIGY